MIKVKSNMFLKLVHINFFCNKFLIISSNESETTIVWRMTEQTWLRSIDLVAWFHRQPHPVLPLVRDFSIYRSYPRIVYCFKEKYNTVPMIHRSRTKCRVLQKPIAYRWPNGILKKTWEKKTVGSLIRALVGKLFIRKDQGERR